MSADIPVWLDGIILDSVVRSFQEFWFFIVFFNKIFFNVFKLKVETEKRLA